MQQKIRSLRNSSLDYDISMSITSSIPMIAKTLQQVVTGASDLVTYIPSSSEKSSTLLIFQLPQELGSLRYEYNSLMNTFSYYADADYQNFDFLPTEENHKMLAEVMAKHAYSIGIETAKIRSTVSIYENKMTDVFVSCVTNPISLQQANTAESSLLKAAQIENTLEESVLRARR